MHAAREEGNVFLQKISMRIVRGSPVRGARRVKLVRGVLGLALWAAIGYVVFYFVSFEADDPLAIADAEFDQTLGAFAARDSENRNILVQAAAIRGGHPKEDLQYFRLFG